MKESEAIKFLRIHFEYLKERWKPHPDYNVLEAIRFAISAIEKQIPKKPRKTDSYRGVLKRVYAYACPTCGNACLEKIHERTAEYNVLLELWSKIRLG